MFAHKIVSCLTVGALSFTLLACGSQEATQQEAESKAPAEEKTEQVEEVAEEDDRQVVGQESEDALEVALTNKLGADIVVVSVRQSGEEAYSDNYLQKDARIAADEEVRLFVAKPADEGKTFDISVALDGQEDALEFLEVDLANMTSVSLVSEDGVAFVDYTDNASATGSTKDAAVARKQAAEEAAAAEAQEQAEAQDDSVNAEAYEEPEYSYEEPTYTYEEPVYAPVEEPSAPAQSEDACVSDVVFR